MSKFLRANHPLKLEGSSNTRDLGGYPTADGINTINGAFLRSDKPSQFTEKDKEILYNYGVRVVLDIRSEGECAKEPCVLKDYKDIAYVNVELLDNVHSDPTKMQMPDDMGQMYCEMIDTYKAGFQRLFKEILRYPDACVFYNCTGGKDRTGTLSAMLLLLAGVPEDVIVKDYSTSAYNLDADKMLAQMAAAGMNLPRHVVMSDPENMETFISHVKAKYGKIENYLTDIGLTAEEIEALRNKLLGK